MDNMIKIAFNTIELIVKLINNMKDKEKLITPSKRNIIHSICDSWLSKMHIHK